MNQKAKTQKRGRPPKEFLTAEEVAEKLGIHRATVIRQTIKGTIPGRKFGRSYRYDWEEILEYGEIESPI